MSDHLQPASTTGPKIVRGATAGLVAGILASFAMDLFQAVAAPSTDSSDDDEPATVKAADKAKIALTGTPIDKADRSSAGQIVHYGIGALLGLAYGVAAEFRPGITAGYGTAFGVGVAATLDEVAVPAAGLGSAPWKTDAGTQLYSLLSHLVFGTVAELARRQVRTTLLPAG